MRSVRQWKVTAVIVALVAASAIGFLSNSPASAVNGGPDDDGRLLLGVEPAA